MALLPNAGQAFVSIEKLTRYCLSPDHAAGRHKARVFASALGLGSNEAAYLAGSLRVAATEIDAVLERADGYGVHYSLEFVLEFQGRSAVIRSLWVIRRDEDFPRLVSAFVK